MKMKKTFTISALVLAALLLGASPAALANLITNGSFEADDFSGGGSGYVLGLVGNDVTGWFIPASDGTYPWGLQNSNAFSAGPAADGNQWIVLGRYDTGVEYTIQQTMTGLVAGDTYSLSFAIASEQGCCSQIEASFLSGSSTASQTFTAPTSGSYWTDWATESMNFLATSSTVTLQFQNINPTSSGFDVGLDNVIVTGASVPEPTTLALLGLGLGGIGFFSRRRETN